MKNLFFICALIFSFFVTSAIYAENYYVRPESGEYGSEDGLDWNNAFDGFADIEWGKLGGGDTVWVAGGTYNSDLTIGASGTNDGNRIFVKRADSSDSACTSAAGWKASYDSQIVQKNGGNIRIYSPHDFVTISGRVWHGWKIEHGHGTSGVVYAWSSGTSTGVVLEYLWLQGPGYPYNFSSHTRNIDVTAGTSSTRVEDGIIQYCDMEKGSSNIYFLDVYDFTVQWNWIHSTNDTDGSIHENAIYCQRVGNLTIRYNIFWNQGAETIFFNGAYDNMKIYGNLAYSQHTFFKMKYGGGKGNLIYNNTLDVGNLGGIIFKKSPADSSNKVKNNIAYDDPVLTYQNADNDYNWYSGSNSEAHGISGGSVDPFDSGGGSGYAIVSTVGSNYPRNKGMSLGGPYNKDCLTNFNPVAGSAVSVECITRGGDGSWDIGAFEYNGGFTSELDPPQNLRIVKQ